jgi:hypothetical protein
MSTSPTVAMKRSRNRTIRHIEDITVVVIDVHDLPAKHTLCTAKTLMCIRGAAEYEGRRVPADKIDAQMRTGRRLCFYMIHVDAVICRLVLQAVEGVAHIDDVDCYTANPRVQPRAYLLFHQIAQLLMKAGVVKMILTLVDTDRSVCRFYSSLGFVSVTRGLMQAEVVAVLAATTRIFT